MVHSRVTGRPYDNEVQLEPRQAHDSMETAEHDYGRKIIEVQDLEK
jgi:hypothetical protein